MINWLTAKYSINDLKDYEHNPRILKKDELGKLVKSIKQDGYHQRVIIDIDGTIIGGHQRKKALLKAGLKEIEVLVPDRKLTEEEFDRINIRDNLQVGEFDFDILANRFEPETLIDWGMPEDWLKVDVEEIEAEEGDNDVPDMPIEPTTKLGDIWVLGEHRLMCGNSVNVADVEKLMNGEKADLLFTDPPYNIASDSSNFAADCSKSMNDLKNSDWDKDFDVVPAIINGICFSNDSASYYIWSSHFLIDKVWDTLKQYCDITTYLVWSKPNPMPSLSKRHPTWNTELCAYGTRGSKRIVNFPNEGHFLSCREVLKKSDGTHPTQKPIELILPLIQFSSGVGQLILDLFGGSGSTLIACEKSKRKCFMMELSPNYCDVIIARWEKHTGNKAELINGQQ